MDFYVFPDPTSANAVFQFKISLKYPKPLIWRRVLVPNNYTFKDLHFVIQSVYNWSSVHLHKFNLKDHLTGVEIEVGNNGEFGMEEWVCQSLKLFTYFKKEKDKATYEYDFGSTWHHNILLEKILPVVRTKKYPQCIAGRGDNPPEHDGESPTFFDVKLVNFGNCLDCFTTDEEEVKKVESEDLSSNKNASHSSNFSSYDGPIGKNSKMTSTEVKLDPKQTDLSVKFASDPFMFFEQEIENKRKFTDYLLSQNSNKITSSILPEKKKVPEVKETKSVPAKIREKKAVQIKITKNSESDQSNNKGCAEDIIVNNATEDAEDNYGKLIASQLRTIKDLGRREDLQVEIQQLINKHMFKN